MLILFIILIFITLLIICLYNSIVNSKKKVEQSYSVIDVYLKQRFDLIPNLVECVKGYAKHEEETLAKIIEMRSNYLSSKKNLEEGSKLNYECDKLLMLAENYPDLKADEQFINLQKNLVKLESQLQAARRIYNVEVTAYNTKISIFPNNLLAKLFGFNEESLFCIKEDERANIKVNLDNKE